VDGGVVAAGEVAAVAPLDLDHVRPKVGQVTGAERPSHGLFQGEDANAGEGASGGRHGLHTVSSRHGDPVSGRVAGTPRMMSVPDLTTRSASGSDPGRGRAPACHMDFVVGRDESAMNRAPTRENAW